MDEQRQPWRTIPELVRWAAGRYGARTAVTQDGVELTFGQLATAATQAARAFVAAGVEQGDRVAVWAPNRPEWVVALLGAQEAGAVVVPLNTRFKGAEAAYILDKSRARLLVTVADFLGNDYVDMLRGHDLPLMRQRVVIGGAPPPTTTGWEAFLRGGDAITDATVAERAGGLGPDDLCDMLFTSGTTGRPKGVPGGHGQTLRAFRTWTELAGLREGDRYLLVNPMFHSFGYRAGILASIMAGATLVPVPVFDVDVVLDLIAAERITVMPGPPTLYQSLLNHPRLAEADLSSLRLAVTGASTIPVQLVRRMQDELGIATVVTAYGLTETMGLVTMCRPDDDTETIALTSGRAVPGVEVMVVDDAGVEVPRGHPGEVVVRGYNVIRGYFEDQEQTAATIDADGWLHTGDVAVMDDGGNVRITDRKNDVFIVGGFNAYPAEIESLLLDNVAIAQATVVGVPDERMGEVGYAFVVLRHGASATAPELIEWARGHMANYKVPRRIEIVDGLPLNASGKVPRYEMRDRALAAMGTPAP